MRRGRSRRRRRLLRLRRLVIRCLVLYQAKVGAVLLWLHLQRTESVKKGVRERRQETEGSGTRRRDVWWEKRRGERERRP